MREKLGFEPAYTTAAAFADFAAALAPTGGYADRALGRLVGALPSVDGAGTEDGGAVRG